MKTQIPQKSLPPFSFFPSFRSQKVEQDFFIKKFLTFFGKPSSARLTNLDLCPSLFQAKIYIFIKKCFKEGKNLAFNYPSVPKNKTNFKFEEGVEVSPFNLTITYVSVVRYVFIWPKLLAFYNTSKLIQQCNRDLVGWTRPVTICALFTSPDLKSFFFLFSKKSLKRKTLFDWLHCLNKRKRNKGLASIGHQAILTDKVIRFRKIFVLIVWLFFQII